MLFKSEAIVHPDEVISYISPGECRISYNPLQMALTWEALATRDGRLLQQALDRRHALPAGTAWVNYVRSHDDIGWTFADEDAAELGIEGYPHRRFLNDFYVGRVDGTFSRGVPFQENPKTGDARITGTTASLAGIEAGDAGGEDRVILAHAIALSTGGIPLLYLGDEVAQLNDYSYREDPAHAGDSRWVHRPERPAGAYAARADDSTVAGRVHGRLTALIAARQRTPEFAATSWCRSTPRTRPWSATSGPARPGRPSCSCWPTSATTPCASMPRRSPASPRTAVDVVTDDPVSLGDGLPLPAHGFVWLRATPLRGR